MSRRRVLSRRPVTSSSLTASVSFTAAGNAVVTYRVAGAAPIRPWSAKLASAIAVDAVPAAPLTVSAAA